MPTRREIDQAAIGRLTMEAALIRAKVDAAMSRANIVVVGDASPCPFATSVSKKIAERAKVGKEKYGVTCARTDLDLHAWLTHLQEELMDAAVYIERAKAELNES